MSSAATAVAQRARGIVKIVTARKQLEGGGFVVRRPLGGQDLPHLGGTFLMLDHMGPVSYEPGQAVGAPDHPHRGFETVTYVLQGSLDHLDSAGHGGHLRAGGVQWMRAGSGVVHSEMPSAKLQRRGGTVEGFQLWVNLPKEHKMSKPRYQEIEPESIPEAKIPGAKSPESLVRVIAGSSCGISAVIETHTPINYIDVRLQAGDALEQAVPADHVGFVYVYKGQGLVASKSISESQMAILADDDAGKGGSAAASSISADGTVTATASNSSIVRLEAPADSEMRCIVITGTEIAGPVVKHGPFVMNSEEEIRQAIMDYRTGKLGQIEGAEERYAQTASAVKSQKASGAYGK